MSEVPLCNLMVRLFLQTWYPRYWQLGFHYLGESRSLFRDQRPDFSIVLFRSDSMLFSKENHVKTHRNQRLWSMLYPPEAFLEPHAEDTPRHRRCRRLRSDLRWANSQKYDLQVLENKVLSRDIIGKPAPILADITIRKSQRLTTP